MAPEVRIHVPAPLVPGVRGRVDLEVRCRRATRIEFIDVEVIAKTVCGGSSIQHNSTERLHGARMLDATVLPEGPSRHTLELDLPATTSPTYEVLNARSTLELHVRIGRARWRPDNRAMSLLVVHPMPLARVTRVPAVYRTDDPKVQIGLSLASTRILVGEPVLGALALYHVDDSAPRQIWIELAPMLKLLPRGAELPLSVPSLVGSIWMPRGGAGASIPFQLPPPALMPASFRAGKQELWWRLRISSAVSMMYTVEIAVPIEVVHPGPGASVERLGPPPRLPDERAAAVLARFGTQHGWTPSYDPRTGSLSVVRGELRMTSEPRGAEGTYLVARIESPSLGLGLEVVPSSTVRDVFVRDLVLGVGDWDKAHRVLARSADQAVAPLGPVARVMAACARPGNLVRWTDRELELEWKIESLEVGMLVEVAQELEQIAAAVTEARAAVGPPAGVTVDAEAWRALAKRWRGALSLGDVSIDGKLDDGQPVRVGLEFDDDGAPHAMRVSIGEAEAAEVPPVELADLVAALPDDVDRAGVRVGKDGATASWRAPVVDAVRVRELASQLRGLVAALSPNSGPYR